MTDPFAKLTPDDANEIANEQQQPPTDNEARRATFARVDAQVANMPRLDETGPVEPDRPPTASERSIQRMVKEWATRTQMHGEHDDKTGFQPGESIFPESATVAALEQEKAWAMAALGKVWAALTGGDEGQTISPDDVLKEVARKQEYWRSIERTANERYATIIKLEQDKKRLDWLDARGRVGRVQQLRRDAGRWVPVSFWLWTNVPSGPMIDGDDPGERNLRAAIDAERTREDR